MTIGENQVGSGTTIDYSPLTSCITATCVLDNVSLAGVHLVFDKRDSAQSLIENDLAQLVGSERVNKIYLVGVTACWREDKVKDITYFKVMEWLCNKFNTENLETYSTQGKGETVSVSAVSSSEAKVSITY